MVVGVFLLERSLACRVRVGLGVYVSGVIDAMGLRGEGVALGACVQVDVSDAMGLDEVGEWVDVGFWCWLQLEEKRRVQHCRSGRFHTRTRT